MSAQETNNASEETLHAPSQLNACNDPSGTTIKAYDAEQDAGMTPLRTPLVARESEASSARTIRDDTTGLDKEKGGDGSNKESNNGGDGDNHRRRPGLLERTTSGHTRIEKREDGKVELKEKAVYDQLGFSWSNSKKWWILSIIFLVQLSMNMNASIYGSALEQFENYFNVVPQVARLGQGLFLICYAFGCELWAPFSEELGRKPVLQASLFLVNVWALACALAPNFPALVIFRVLQGFSSAGGSVTLGMVADMFEPERQGNAVAFIVFSSVAGSVLGPIVGGFQARYLSWHWNFWLQLIFGGAVQLLHLLVPETKASILTTRIAKQKRAKGEEVYSTHELEKHKWEVKAILQIMSRPFIMFATEPIVLCLSLLSGFSDALIFTFLESFGPIFRQWNFGTVALGLTFIPLLVGYCISYLSFIPFIKRDEKTQADRPDDFQPEQKLYWLLYTAPLLSIGLFAFAWTSQGPAINPWIVPLIFSALIGIANYAIYFATIDYMIHAYGPYSASATGGNGFARDFLAGIATFYSTPLYQNIGNSHQFAFGSTVLGGLAIAVTIPIYIFYVYGPKIRSRSKFAQVLKGDREASKSDEPSGGEA